MREMERGEVANRRSRIRAVILRLEDAICGIPLHRGDAQRRSSDADRTAKPGPQNLHAGVGELLKALNKTGVRIAAITSHSSAEGLVQQVKLEDAFELLVHCQDEAGVERAFADLLSIAARLGVPPSDCAVADSDTDRLLAGELIGMLKLGVDARSQRCVTRPDVFLSDLAGLTSGEVLRHMEESRNRTDPWTIFEGGVEAGRARETQTNLTVGNGFICTRGSLEERASWEGSGTLIAGIYDNIPVFHTELASIPDWTALDLIVDGERFSVDRGEILSHVRELDLRDGLLRRHVRWKSPEGTTLEVGTVRLASMADRHLCVQLCTVACTEGGGKLVCQARLGEYADNPGIPPFPDVRTRHWETLAREATVGAPVTLHMKTCYSGIELGMAMELTRIGVDGGKVCVLDGACPGMTCEFLLRAGETAVLVKLVAVNTSLETSSPLDASLATLKAARRDGLARILIRHRTIWRDLWDSSDIEIDGDEPAQRALRFNLYHLLIAAPWTAHTSIPAKTLSGFGYRGHVFWDTDTFMLPFFTFTQPDSAKNLVLYRYHTLPGACEKAKRAGYEGAMYAWESAASGTEVTPRWVPGEDGSPISIVCGELEQHVTADVAHATWQYWRVTGDDRFMLDYGVEILVRTARFWTSRAERDPAGNHYVIRHVMGPDEYHADIDNNAYTNALAARNLVLAAKALDWMLERDPDRSATLLDELGLSEGEVRGWTTTADRIVQPFCEETGLIEQFEGYFVLEDIDVLHWEDRFGASDHVLDPQGTQIIKQPDVMMLLFLLGDSFEKEVKRVNWAYYESRTDLAHGSSLGPPIHAAIAAQLGETENAYRQFMAAATANLEFRRTGAGDGIYGASSGGVWQAVVFGFAGVRMTADGLVAWPQLPNHWKKLKFSLGYQGKRFVFELAPKVCGPILPREIP